MVKFLMLIKRDGKKVLSVHEQDYWQIFLIEQTILSKKMSSSHKESLLNIATRCRTKEKREIVHN